MELSLGLTILLLAILLAANIFASVVILRVPMLSLSQRRLQLAFIWLVPLLGAVICAAFAYAQSVRTSSPSTIDALYLDSDPTVFDGLVAGNRGSGDDPGLGAGGDGD